MKVRSDNSYQLRRPLSVLCPVLENMTIIIDNLVVTSIITRRDLEFEQCICVSEANFVSAGTWEHLSQPQSFRHSVSSFATVLTKHDTHHNITSHTNLLL